MSSKIKYSLVSVFVVFCVVVFFYLTGCCSKGGGGGSGFVAGSVGGNQAQPKLFDVKVNEDGSITKTLAPSGRLSIEAPKSTLNKEVVVHMVESQAVGNESDIYSIGKYIYTIKPDREEKNETGIKTGSNPKRDVKMQTNPIILTFSDDERLTGAENYYIGIKEIGSKEWQFVNVYSATNPQINSNGPKASFEYKLYKDNVMVALFADFNKSLGDRPKVLSMVASMPDNVIEILDGRYNEDAVIKLKFIGDNLSSLRADDYKIRLHYANNDSKQVNIRIDGKTASYISGTSTNKYEAFGELYAHYYEFIPTTATYTTGVTPELSFTLNFKKFPIEDFSSDFVVEAFNATDRPVPFSLSDSLHFDTEEEKDPEPEAATLTVALSLASDSTHIFDTAKNLYYLNPRFTITASPSYEFTDEAKAAIASSVTLVEMNPVVRANIASSTDASATQPLADEELLTTEWNENGLVIGFKQRLATYTQYVLSLNDISSFEGVNIEPFSSFTFRTAGTVDVRIASESTNVIDAENNLYHCRPMFTVNPGFTPNESEKAAIASAVSVIGAEDGIVTRTWNSGVLSVGFSRNLAADTEYTVSMTEPAGMERLCLNPFQPLKFKTTGDFYIALVPDADNVFDTENTLYRCRPGFTITPSTALGDEDQAKIASAVVVTGIDEAFIQKIWASGSLSISFTQDIGQNTEFTLSLSDLPEIEGRNFITFQPFVFRTMGALELALTPDADNVYAAVSPKYHCRPGFTITPSISLNEEDRVKIASAVSVLNASPESIVREWNNEGSLRVTFNQNLTPNTEYTFSLNAVNDIKGVSLNAFEPLAFTTVGSLSIALAPDANNVYDAVNQKYRCNPTFTVTPAFALNEEDRTRISSAVAISNGASVVKNWESNSLRISFSQNLATDTAYMISMSPVNDIKGINVVPFEALNFTTVGALGFTVTPDEDNVYAAVSPKYQCRPGFTITPAITLNDEDKARIADAVTLSNAGNIASKTWDANSLKITLTQNLATDTAYTLSMAAVNDINGVTVTPFAPVEFTTIGELNFTVTPDDDNLFDIQNSLTHCKPGFTVTPAFALNDADKTKILNAVTVADVASSSVVRQWSNEGSLHVGFSTKLASGTDYSLNMAVVDDIKGVTVMPFDPQPFRTMNAINVTLDSEDSNVIDVPNNLYHCRPQFTITPGYDADDSAKEIIASAVSVIGADENNITRTWVNDSLVIGFASNLTTNTEYTISIGDLNASFEKLAFRLPESLTFTTTGDSYVAIVPDEGNVIVSTPSELYHCRPTFTITPSVALGDSDRATIAGAIHVSNVHDGNLTKNWNASGSLILGFTQNLTHNTQYTVSIDSIGEIAGINLVLFQPLTFTTVPELNLVLTADTGNAYEAVPSLYRCNPAFTITPSFALSDASKAIIADAVSVSNSAVTVKNWDGNNLRITFSSNLAPDSFHTISMAAVSSITGVTVNAFASQDFTTLPALTFTLDSPDSNVFISTPAERYHCRPVFTLTPAFNLNDADRTIIANAVTISSNASLMTKNWNGNVLEIGFSSDLANNTNYTLSMNAVTSISGVTVTPVTPKSFTTIEGLVISIASDSGDVFTIENGTGLYQTLPTFTVTSNMPLNVEDQAKIAAVISVSNVDPGKVTKSWANATTLNIGFMENLSLNTNYIVTMAAVNNISGVTVTAFSPLNFRTMNALTFNVAADSGNVYEALDPLYRCNPSFTITPNYTLSETVKTTIANAVSVTNSLVTSKNWNGNNLRVTFTSALTPDSTYTLNMAEVNSITGVTVTPFASRNFTTVPALTFTLNSPDSNVFISTPAERYHCRPVFTLTPSFNLNDADKTIIANAVTISSNANLMTKNWNGNVLEIGFSSDLANSTNYTISMNAVTSISGVTVTPVTPKSFTTIEGLVISIASDSGDVFAIENSVGLYQTLPTFTVTSNMALSATDQTKIANAISVSNVADNKVTKNWANSTTLNISFTENLTHDTDYTISMGAVSNISGVTVTGFSPLNFRTMEALTIALIPDAGNIFVSTPELYHGRPAFTVTSRYALNADDKAKIAVAVSLTGTDSAVLTKNWTDDKTLRLTFGSDLGLGSRHTISMNTVNNITGVTVSGFADKIFNSIGALTFTATPDAVNVYEALNPLYRCTPAFTITPNYTLSETVKTTIANAVSVTNSAVTSKNWEGNNLRVTFTSNLAPDSYHELSMAAVNSITGVTVTPFASQNFTTVPALTFTLNSPDSNVFISTPAERYHCRPVFTLTPSFTLNAEDRTIVANAVTISSNASLMTKNWNGNVLEIGFSSDLANDTDYTLSMNAVTSISGVSVTPFTAKNFTTIEGLRISIASDSGDVFAVEDGHGLYQTLPTFTVTSNMALSTADQEKIASAISVSDVDSNKVTKSWVDSTTLNISFTENLTHDTSYTISMGAVNDISGVTVTGFSNLAFTTMETLTIALTPDAGNIFVSTPELYHCRPAFTVTSRYSLNADDKAKIAAAVTLTGTDSAVLTKNWTNDRTLRLTFASDLGLGSSHNLSMNAVNNITGVTVSGFADKTFNTIGALTFTVIPDTGNVYEAMSPKYHCRPAFTISPNYSLSALSDASRTVLLNAVAVSDSSGLSKVWNNDNIRLTFSSNQSSGNHTLSMSAVDFTGITVAPFADLNFTILDTLTFAIATGSTDVYEAMSPKYRLNPTFTITPSFNLNAADKTNVENAVSVTNSDITSKVWDNNNLVITFSQNLYPDTTYTLTMGNVSGMNNISLTKFSDLAFTTLPILAFTLTKDSDNVFYDGKYHCRPGFTVTPSFTVNDDDKSFIADAISLTNVSDSIITKTWNDNVLTLGFTQNIATSTSYTLSMSAINNISGVRVSPFTSFSFTTIPDLIVSIATTTTSIVKQANSTSNLSVNGKNYLYCQSPQYEVSVNMTLDDTNKAKIKDAISGEGAISSLLTKSAWNGNKITLGFSSTLDASTTYRILMSDITDIKGVNVKTIPSYSFTTFFHQGKGTETDPFTIYTPAQLACLDYYPKQAYFYKQMENLNLSVYENWKPIGGSNSSLNFIGKYNGNNKTISNAVINYPDTNNIGLFAYSSNAVFSNINIENFTVLGSSKVGSICGTSYNTTISNIFCDFVNVSGVGSVGGAFGEIYNSTINTCNITNTIASSSSTCTGGFVARVDSNSNISGITCDEVTIKGIAYVGGAFGSFFRSTLNSCMITNTVASCTSGIIGGCAGYVGINSDISEITCDNVTIEGTSKLGGAFGNMSKSNLTTCNVTNSIASGSSYPVGGCIGLAENELIGNGIHCENLQVKGNSLYVGGCIGRTENNCEFSNIICDDVAVEGKAVVGGAFGSFSGSKIITCNVANSSVSASSQSTGGCIGEAFNGSSIDNIVCKNLSIHASSYGGGCVGQTSGNSNLTNITCDEVSIEGNSWTACAFGYFKSSNLNNCNVINSIASSSTYYNGGCIGGVESSIVNSIKCKNLYINSLKGYAGGCLGHSYNYSEFNDIICDNVIVEGKEKIGVAMGNFKGQLQNCKITNSIASGGSYIGGLIGCTNTDSNIFKCFAKDSEIKSTGYTKCIGGLIGELASSTIDSCYITGCSIELGLAGLIGSSSSDITNCYMYNSTITCSTNYGAIVGTNGSGERETLISDCFISQDYDILIKTNFKNEPVNCYYNVNDLSTFNSKTWSEGAWSNYNTSVFPPQLTDLPEP